MEKCCVCGRELVSDEIAVNRKLIADDVREKRCIECLAVFLETDTAAIEKKIQQFKDEGCKKFFPKDKWDEINERKARKKETGWQGSIWDI